MDKTIFIKQNLILLAITIVDDRGLRKEPNPREILPLDIRDKDMIVTQILCDVVQTTVSIFLEPLKPCKIILESVVITITKESYAELRILEKEATEIAGERLDADPHAIKVIAVTYVTQVLINKQRLNTHEGISSPSRRPSPLVWVNI